MKDTQLTKAADKAIIIKMKAIDRLMEDLIEPLKEVGNPESLIGKPYETWTPMDFQMLTKIYGEGDDTPLADLIFRKEYDKVKALEAEELT